MLDTLITHALDLAVAAAVPFVAAAIYKVMAKLATKYHLQSTIITQQQIEAFILQQILRVKEEVATAIKNKVDPLAGDAKLESVVTAVLEKFPGIDQQEATDLPHALLAGVGEGATHLSDAALHSFLQGQSNLPLSPGSAKLQ